MRAIRVVGTSVAAVVCLLGAAAVSARSQAPPPSPLEAFARARYFWEQLDAAKQIARAGDRAVLAAMDRWIASEDRKARANAAFVLASFGDPRGFDVLRAVLIDRGDRAVDAGMLRGNESQASHAVQLARQIEDDRYHAVSVLAALRMGAGVDLLLPLLRDDHLAEHAAWALGEIGDRRAVPPLVEMLADVNAAHRIAAVRALDALRATEAVSPLQALLGDLAKSSGALVADEARAAIAHLSQPGLVPRLLPPSAFNNLPIGVRQVLEQRGCEIPQTWTGGAPHNVIRGRFTSKDEPDLAVLCSIAGASRILVFRGESPARVDELATERDEHYFQDVDGRGRMGFSRGLSVATASTIGDHPAAAGFDSRPATLDHDGIDDAFVEKASVVWYWDGARWLRLAGADAP